MVNEETAITLSVFDSKTMYLTTVNIFQSNKQQFKVRKIFSRLVKTKTKTKNFYFVLEAPRD